MNCALCDRADREDLDGWIRRQAHPATTAQRFGLTVTDVERHARHVAEQDERERRALRTARSETTGSRALALLAAVDLSPIAEPMNTAGMPENVALAMRRLDAIQASAMLNVGTTRKGQVVPRPDHRAAIMAIAMQLRLNDTRSEWERMTPEELEAAIQGMLEKARKMPRR